MNIKIVEIGRIIAFIGVIPMMGVAAAVAYSQLPEISSLYMQIMTGSVAPGSFIWIILAEGDTPSWGRSSTKDIFKALLIISAGLVALIQVPYMYLYDSMQLMISQTGVMISVIGAIVIIIGALMKS
jgi:hypothetical protein